MFVVTVNFVIEPTHFQDFVIAMKRIAQASLNNEEHCLQFDVCLSDNSREVFLYEVYTGAEDFDVHLSSDHFKEFNQLTGAWVLNKVVSTYNRVPIT
jgi:quinol monooxygenase YgiN